LVPKAWKEALWFGRSQYNKENKQTTFLNREIPLWEKKNYNEKTQVFKFFSIFCWVQTSKDLPLKNH
jgi:hypothetical protein